MSTMDNLPWLNDLEPSPSLAGAQTLTDITRNVAKALGVPMTSDLADMVKSHAQCEVNYHGEAQTVVGMHHILWLPDASGSLTEPIFHAETALEIAQIAIVDWRQRLLTPGERMKAQQEFEASLLEPRLRHEDSGE